MKKGTIFLLALIFIAVFTNCSGDRPHPKTARAKAKSFLKSYGRKYETTAFYKNVSDVEINAIEPVSHRIVNTDTIVHFGSGEVARGIFKMENKFPRGWKVISWEIVGLE